MKYDCKKKVHSIETKLNALVTLKKPTLMGNCEREGSCTQGSSFVSMF